MKIYKNNRNTVMTINEYKDHDIFPRKRKREYLI